MPLNTTQIIEEPSSGFWTNAESPDVYVDIFGTTHVVWVATHSGVKRIFYTSDDGLLNFNPPTLVSNVNRNCNNPKIAANNLGKILIVFEIANITNNGSDIHFATNSGTFTLATSTEISNNTGPALYNTNPRLVINDQNTDPQFAWLGTHSITGKTVAYYTRTIGISPYVKHQISPDANNNCSHLEIELFGNLNRLYAIFEQTDGTTLKQNIRLVQGDQAGFTLLGPFQDTGGLAILNRPTFNTNNTYPRFAVNPRIYDIADSSTSDDDPTIVVVWEDDDSPNNIKFSQRYQSDFSDGTVAMNNVHRPVVAINNENLIHTAYYKNNVVNLSFKDVASNQWTEVNDISSGHADGNGLYNIEMLCDGNANVYISFKTGPTTGPQRIVHVNNFRTNSLFSFEVFTKELDSPSDTRSAVAMHLDNKLANRQLISNADSRAAVVFTDYTVDFAQPDGIGDVYVFGGTIASQPKSLAVTDLDGDNKPEFSWFIKGEEAMSHIDIYYRLCGASGIIPYEENVMLSGTFVSGIIGYPEPGYVYTHTGPSGINIANLYGFGVRQRGGPWSDEFCFRLGDISISHPTIIPPDNDIDVEKCSLVTLGGQAEPGSTIDSQTLVEYSDLAGTIELQRTIITAYTVNPSGHYSGSMALSLLPNTASIRSEVIARDIDNNLSDPAESQSNLVVVQNIPPVFISINIQSQATGSDIATNSLIVNVITETTGNPAQIKCWEDISAGGTGEIGAIWQTYNSVIAFTFANNTNEIKTIFCKLRDACNNESLIVSDTIELDTVPPQIIAATFDPATRRLTLSFSEPVTSLDLSKIRIVKP